MCSDYLFAMYLKCGQLRSGNREEVTKRLLLQIVYASKWNVWRKVTWLSKNPSPASANKSDGNILLDVSSKNVHVSSEITGIDLELIETNDTIMVVVTSRKYGEILGSWLVILLGFLWLCNQQRNVSPNLHECFIHGPEIISCALIANRPTDRKHRRWDMRISKHYSTMQASVVERRRMKIKVIFYWVWIFD